MLILETHAQSLQRLAALFGEEVLFELLEMQEDEPKRVTVHTEYFQAPVENFPKGQAYGELESMIRHLKLHPILEFHLWAYPHYRSYIESSLDLNSIIPSSTLQSSDPIGARLVEEAISEAKKWIQNLPLPPAFAAQAERVAEIPWLKFRASVLKKIGKRPLGPVY